MSFYCGPFSDLWTFHIFYWFYFRFQRHFEHKIITKSILNRYSIIICIRIEWKQTWGCWKFWSCSIDMDELWIQLMAINSEIQNWNAEDGIQKKTLVGTKTHRTSLRFLKISRTNKNSHSIAILSLLQVIL